MHTNKLGIVHNISYCGSKKRSGCFRYGIVQCALHPLSVMLAGIASVHALITA